jgi:hypothetical protein
MVSGRYFSVSISLDAETDLSKPFQTLCNNNDFKVKFSIDKSTATCCFVSNKKQSCKRLRNAIKEYFDAISVATCLSSVWKSMDELCTTIECEREIQVLDQGGDRQSKRYRAQESEEEEPYAKRRKINPKKIEDTLFAKHFE